MKVNYSSLKPPHILVKLGRQVVIELFELVVNLLAQFITLS